MLTSSGLKGRENGVEADTHTCSLPAQAHIAIYVINFLVKGLSMDFGGVCRCEYKKDEVSKDGAGKLK